MKTYSRADVRVHSAGGGLDCKGRRIEALCVFASNCPGELKVKRIGFRLRECLKARN